MNIVFATTDLYSKPTLITIKTLLMNNKNADEINIYYVESQISNENKQLITELVKEYGRYIQFIQMPEQYKNIEGLIRTNAIVYSYCYFQDILPASVEKVILLEADSIVVDDLSEMYSINIDDYYLAAADDLQSKWYKRKLGMKEDSPYFNCGIMLLNLKKWREDKISGKITELINDGHSKFFYEVQDELNVLMEGKVKILPPCYNCTTAIFLFEYNDMLHYRRPTTACSKVDFEHGKKNPAIVHFTKNQIIQPRPWIKGCSHPYKGYYEKIKSETKLANEELWEEKRSFINIIIGFLYSNVSKGLTARLLGRIHSFWYPVFLYRFILR